MSHGGLVNFDFYRIFILFIAISVCIRHEYTTSRLYNGDQIRIYTSGIRIKYGYIGGFHVDYGRRNLDLERSNHIFSRDSRISYLAEERYYKMITDKRASVDQLIRDHSDPNDKLQLRLNYVQCTMNHKLFEMLRRNSNDSSHKLSVIADMKRRTPTHNPRCDNNVLSYANAAEVAHSMASTGFDVIFVNTDELFYGGHVQDLYKCFLELRKLGRRIRPAIVMKDIILHPIQIAQAAEYRADGVLLNSAILGNALKDMIVHCIDMGIEAIVEAHDMPDLMRAVEMGANHVMINQWDRLTNVLHPSRAIDLIDEIPERVTAIACGGIMTMKQVHELALLGYDAVVFGKRLKFPDVPDFIKCVKDWKGPSKGILKLSRNMLFNIVEDKDGYTTITLKDNHLENDLSDALEFEKETQPPIDPNKPSYTEEILTEEDKSRAITLSIGTPTTPTSTTKVGTLTITEEGQKQYIDENEYNAKRRENMYRLKWFIERRKWLKANRHFYASEEDANSAYDLKKAIEMYNKFILKAKKGFKSLLTKKEIDDMEVLLFNNVKELYKKAPKKLNIFDNPTGGNVVNTPDGTNTISQA